MTTITGVNTEGLALNTVHEGDCLELMREIPEESVDLIVTSPPYNIGKSYEKRKPIEDYMEAFAEFFSESLRILKDGGNMLFQVGQYVDDETNNIPLTYLFYPVAINAGLKLRQEIVWHFRGGMPAKVKLTGQNEKLMWLYKGESRPYFDVDSIRVKEWQAYDKRNNPNGKNPTDVWYYNRVAGNSKEKTAHPCQFPTEMIERICKGWAPEHGVVLDPFIGSGTTAVAAINTGRQFIGIEKEPEYVAIANERIAKARAEVANV